MSDGRRQCDCCGRNRCNRFYKLPLGTRPHQIIIRACGQCVIGNPQRLREWMDKKEEELREI